MKLFYIVNAKIPTDKANGYQISKMCEEFARAGLDVELWLPTRVSQFKDDPFKFYNLENNFKIKKIKSFDFVKFHSFLGKFGFLLQSLNYFLKLIFKKVDKDVVIYSRNVEIVWLFSLRGYKTIFEAHRWVETKKGIFNFLIKKASKVISVTEELKNKTIESGFPENRVLVAPDAVDLNIFDLEMSKDEARLRLNLPKDKIILGYTGRFRTMGEEKGVGDILKAVRVLLNNFSNIFFVAVGGASEDIEFYKKFAKKLEVEKNILFLESVDRKKLAIYQKAFDVLLMPFPFSNHFAYYMSPLKMFEYMASKRPLLASDLPSIRLVLNNSNSVLVRPGDSKDLAHGIKIILEDKEKAEKISKKAYSDVQNYSWERRAQAILKFISE